MSRDRFKVYFAGPLFDHKDLSGNALLATSIEQVSGGRFCCLLPQDLEAPRHRQVNVRNHDLHQVMACDLALFSFDGPDLDSGTVVEFMLAKFLDIPAVIVRTDLRGGGDPGADSNDWNLMCSFYPRTRIVRLNGLEWYQEARQGQSSVERALKTMYQRIAARIVDELDAARSEPPLPENWPDRAETVYRWALRFPGGGFHAFAGGDEFVSRLLPRKRELGLIP